MNSDIVRRSHDEELAKIGLMMLGQIFCDSGFFKDAADAPKAIVKIIAGREIGFGPMAAMSGIHVIEGKPEIGANLQAISVRQSGRYDYRIKTKTTQVCEIEFFEVVAGKRESLGVETFTIDDAKRAGIASKPNWQRYPKNMLFARCMSNGVASFCPDAVGMRAYSEGEVEERDFENRRGWKAEPTTDRPAGDSELGGRFPGTAEAKPRGTVTVEKVAAAPKRAPKAQDAGGSPKVAAAPQAPPPASSAAQTPGSVAAAMGVEPGSSPLAPDESAAPVVNEETGEVGYVEDPDQGDASEPTAPAAPSGGHRSERLTVDSICALLGPKQERTAAALLEVVKSDAKTDAPISCDAAALIAKSRGAKAVDAAWRDAGGEHDKSGVRLPLRGDQVAAFLVYVADSQSSRKS